VEFGKLLTPKLLRKLDAPESVEAALSDVKEFVEKMRKLL